MHGSTLFLDLRERAVAAVADGATCREVAALFDVAVSSVVKWSGRKRARRLAPPPSRWAGGVSTSLRQSAAGSCLALPRSRTSRCGSWPPNSPNAASSLVTSRCGTSCGGRNSRTKKKACSQASRIGLTLRGAGCAGAACRPCSIPSGSSSSTKHGRRPTWRLCGDGAGAESGPRPALTGTGKR